MSKLYTGMCGLCCLAFLAVISASTRADAQGARNVTPRTSWSDIRGDNPNPDMWQNKGASWSELMDEFENTPIIQQVFTTIIQTRTYDLTTLDNRLTSEAIAWEHVKQAVVDELTARITEEGKAAKNVSKKVYGVSAGISYELLPDQKDIKVILPSLILVEKTDGNQAKGTLRLKARARVAIARIVPMTFAVYGNEATYDEIKGVRRMATDAMSEIVRIQDASTGSREKAR